MEISKLSENGIKIKSKSALLGINAAQTKIVVDAAIFFETTVENFNKENTAVIINGPGEYEIKGIKISGHKKEEAVTYTARIDNIKIGIVKASALPKTKDVLEDLDIVIVEADVIPDQKLIAALNAKVIILSGLSAQEGAKTLGKEVSPITKYVATKDKLPSEMEVVVLG